MLRRMVILKDVQRDGPEASISRSLRRATPFELIQLWAFPCMMLVLILCTLIIGQISVQVPNTRNHQIRVRLSLNNNMLLGCLEPIIFSLALCSRMTQAELVVKRILNSDNKQLLRLIKQLSWQGYLSVTVWIASIVMFVERSVGGTHDPELLRLFLFSFGTTLVTGFWMVLAMPTVTLRRETAQFVYALASMFRRLRFVVALQLFCLFSLAIQSLTLPIIPASVIGEVGGYYGYDVVCTKAINQTYLAHHCQRSESSSELQFPPGNRLVYNCTDDFSGKWKSTYDKCTSFRMGSQMMLSMVAPNMIAQYAPCLLIIFDLRKGVRRRTVCTSLGDAGTLTLACCLVFFACLLLFSE